MSRTKKSVLLPLVAQLKNCPSREEIYSGELLKEQWEQFRGQTVRKDKPSLAILTALILESNFSNLLTREESTQLDIGFCRATSYSTVSQNASKTSTGRAHDLLHAQ